MPNSKAYPITKTLPTLFAKSQTPKKQKGIKYIVIAPTAAKKEQQIDTIMFFVSKPDIILKSFSIF